MTTKLLNTWKRKTNQLKMEVYAIYMAYRDPRVPWYAKILILCIIRICLQSHRQVPKFHPYHRISGSFYLGPTGCCYSIQKDDSTSGFYWLPRNSHESIETQLDWWFHYRFHVVSACIVGNHFRNMGYERLESGSRAVVQVVHTNDINFRIKCSVAKR